VAPHALLPQITGDEVLQGGEVAFLHAKVRKREVGPDELGSEDHGPVRRRPQRSQSRHHLGGCPGAVDAVDENERVQSGVSVVFFLFAH
jgi:hypothetical protein